MARASVISPYQKFWSIDGLQPVSDGTVTFYQNGTTILAEIWADANLSVPQDNPYILDAGGRIQGDVHFAGQMSLVVYDSIGAELYTIDDVTCFDPFVALSEWNESIEYGEGGANIVTGSDGNYYISTAPDNQGNDPTDPANVPGWWQIAQFFQGTQEELDRVIEISNLVPDDQAIIIGNGSTWVTAPLPSLILNFFSGLGTANNGDDADHDIDVATGSCNDSTNTVFMALTSPTTKQIDATWAPGTDAGGLADGATLSPGETYHVFVVRIGEDVDVMFDSDVDCQNGVDNNDVDYFRRIASIMTDGASNIVPYLQNGDDFVLGTMVQDVNDADPGENAIIVKLSVPTGISVLAQYIGALNSDDATQDGYLTFTSLRQSDVVPGNAQYNIRARPQTIDENTFGSLVFTETNIDGEIRYRITAANNTDTSDFTVYVNTIGWKDFR